MQRWLQRWPVFYLLLSAVLFVRAYLLAEGMLLALACTKLVAWRKGKLVTPFLLWLLAGAVSVALSPEPLLAGHAWSAYLSGGVALLLGAACGRSEDTGSGDSVKTTVALLGAAGLVCFFGQIAPALWPTASNPALQSFMPLLAGWQQTLVLSWLLVWAIARSGAHDSISLLAVLSACAFMAGFLGGLMAIGAAIGLVLLAWRQRPLLQQLAWRLACVALLAGTAAFFASTNLHQFFLVHSEFYQQWVNSPANVLLTGMGPDQFSNLFFWRESAVWHPEMILALAGGWGRLLLETGLVGVGALLYLGVCWSRRFPQALPLVAVAACQLFFVQWLDIAWCFYAFLFFIGWTTAMCPVATCETLLLRFGFRPPVLWGSAFLIGSFVFPAAAGLLVLAATLAVLATESPRQWSLAEKCLVVGWGGVIALNSAYSEAPLITMKVWQVYLSYPLFFAAGAVFCAARKKQCSLLRYVPYLLLIAAVHALWQAAGYGAFSFEGMPGSAERVQGQTSNPILFAAYLLVLLLGLFMAEKEWSLSQWLGLLAGETAMVLSGTRGAWLAWLVVLFTAGVFSWKRLLAVAVKQVLACGLIFLFLLGGVYSLSGRSDNGLTRLATAVDTQNDQSNLERLHMWSAAFDMGRRQLWTGVGLHQFAGRYFSDYRPQQDRERLGWQNPHNDYAGWFAETGLPGFTLYLLTLGFLLHKLRRWLIIGDEKKKRVAAAGGLALGGLMTFSLSYSVFTVAPVMRLGLFLAGFFWCRMTVRDKKRGG